MQFDADSAAVAGALAAFAGSTISFFVGNAIMKERLHRLEQDRAADSEACHKELRELKEAVENVKDTHVTYTYFEAVVEPIRRSMNEIQKDVKELLGRVRGNRT